MSRVTFSDDENSVQLHGERFLSQKGATPVYAKLRHEGRLRLPSGWRTAGRQPEST